MKVAYIDRFDDWIEKNIKNLDHNVVFRVFTLPFAFVLILLDCIRGAKLREEDDDVDLL